MKNLRVFPVLKKSSLTKKDDITDFTEEDISEISEHYSEQLLNQIEGHGFELNERFLKDFDYVTDYLYSALMRNVGKYYHCQDTIDGHEELVEMLLKEENKEDID
jgi:hypothetical protein